MTAMQSLGDSGAAFRWLALPEQWVRHRVAIARERQAIARAVSAGREPVFVFCHPRVGSMSLVHAIDRTDGLSAVHLHVVTEGHARWRYGQPLVAESGVARNGAAVALAAREHMARAERTRFVCAVRDPVAVNISFFLYWGRKYWARRQWHRLGTLSLEELGRVFSSRFPHESSVRWMEHEFLPAIGLKGTAVGWLGFDTARGAMVLEAGRCAALVMRSDLPNDGKRAELSAFLQRPVAEVQRNNESSQLFDRTLHERLTAAVARLPGYAERLLETPFTRAFWSDRQREDLLAHWLAVRARG